MPYKNGLLFEQENFYFIHWHFLLSKTVCTKQELKFHRDCEGLGMRPAYTNPRSTAVIFGGSKNKKLIFHLNLKKSRILDMISVTCSNIYLISENNSK